jgi:hypothetical protein
VKWTLVDYVLGITIIALSAAVVVGLARAFLAVFW